MRVLLRDLAPGQEYAIQFRSNNGEEMSDWSQVNRFTTTNDVVAPSAVQNLVWYDSGPSFIGQWSEVTTNADGSELKDFRYYRVAVNDGFVEENFFVIRERFEFTREMNAATFGQFRSSLTITVYAVDMTYNESLPVSKSVDPAAPPVPSAPVLSPYYGSILLEWDGKDNNGAQMPANIEWIEVHIGTTINFDATDETYDSRIILNRSAATQRTILAGLDNGETYYARLVAVDVLQKRSNQSPVSNATTKTNLTGLEIENGQIGKDQINFTARDIGGANAYFPATIAARDALTGMVSGDIAYITGSGYATYRYNGTTWVAAPEVGVVSGTKIIAGTVTADAVGTNLIISAKANIGSAIIDSSHIDQLNANVITAGSLQSQFTVNYAGEVTPRPAWKLDVNGNLLINNAEIKGQLVIGDANNTLGQNANFAIRSFNYVAGLQGWTINGDGTVEFASGTFRGTLRTAITGARVVAGNVTNSSGTFGNIEIYDFNNRKISLTTGTQQTQDPSGNPTLMLGFDDLFSLAEGMTIPANAIHWVKNGTFTLNNGGPVSIIAPGGFQARSTWAGGVSQLGWNPSYGGYMYGPSGSVHRFTATSGGGFDFYTAAPGSIRIANYGNTNASPGIQQFAGSGHGTRMHTYQDSRGTWGEFQIWNGSAWAGIRATTLEAQSDIRLKEDITTADTSFLAEINKTRVAKYRMKRPDKVLLRKPKKGKPNEFEEVEEAAPLTPAPLTVGLIAQEAPSQIVNVADDGSGSGIDLYQMVSYCWGALQEISKRLDALEKGKK